MDQKKKSVVICTFPGAYDDTYPVGGNLKIVELNILQFQEGSYPVDYLKEFLELYNSGKYDYIICTSNKLFRNELKKNNIEYVIIKPYFYDKDIYLKRLFSKRYPINIIKKVSDNWSNDYNNLSDDDSLTINITSNETISHLLYKW